MRMRCSYVMRWLPVAGAVGLALLGSSRAVAQMGGGMGPGGMNSMAGAPPAKGGDDVLPEVDESVAGNATLAFARAEKAFQDEDWLQAIAHYRHITQKFSFNLTFAALAELRLADVAFQRERWSEARGYYRQFLRFHPSHEKAEYARFRVGLCAFKAVPRSLWVEPPAEERDQSEAVNALGQMREFMQRHPASSFASEANDIIRRCEDLLAGHELYVARFYARRGKWAAVRLRADGLLQKFPSSSFVAEALTLSVEANATLGDKEAAARQLDLLQKLAPEAGLLSRARAAAGR